MTEEEGADGSGTLAAISPETPGDTSPMTGEKRGVRPVERGRLMGGDGAAGFHSLGWSTERGSRVGVLRGWAEEVGPHGWFEMPMEMEASRPTDIFGSMGCGLKSREKERERE